MESCIIDDGDMEIQMTLARCLLPPPAQSHSLPSPGSQPPNYTSSLGSGSLSGQSYHLSIPTCLSLPLSASLPTVPVASLQLANQVRGGGGASYLVVEHCNVIMLKVGLVKFFKQINSEGRHL